jgi:2-beta-glucuronyltransferase
MLRTNFDSGEMRSGANKRAMQRYLIISGHDFRTPRWANMHFIARELAQRGTTRFFSIGCSALSYLISDPRKLILKRANRIEEYRGVKCYLWKSAWHPVNLDFAVLAGISRMMFAAYRRNTPDLFQRWVEGSDVIILESGMPPIFLELIHKLNPNARKIYIASDLLDTIGVDPFVSEELNAHIDLFDTIVLPSKLMAPAFSPRAKLCFVPHGLEVDDSASAVSPYEGGINAVSVGSMLFDREFFDIAAPLFPHVTFHVIGSGHGAESLKHANVKIYGEMPYEQTLGYIKHAQFGIAPYTLERAQDYLCDTSMKLMQYAFFGIAAVCPRVAVGEHPGRFGYVPGDRASIENAVQAALKAGKVKIPPMLSWAQVTDRILSPQDFADTDIARALTAPG